MRRELFYARCLCGLRTALHFDHKNRKLNCDDVRRRHPRASVRVFSLRQIGGRRG